MMSYITRSHLAAMLFFSYRRASRSRAGWHRRGMPRCLVGSASRIDSERDVSTGAGRLGIDYDSSLDPRRPGTEGASTKAIP